MTNNKPIITIRDGSLKAAIWRNQSENGSVYSTRLTRTYKDQQDGNFKDADTLSGSELLRASRLLQMAYDQERGFRDQDKATQAE